MNPPHEDPDRNPIEVIADEFIERLRCGEKPTIEEYADRHPEIAEDIRDLLPAVVAMEELKIQKEQSDRSRFLRGPGSLTKLGDFLILAEIGRGGMGIVYEAEQQSLGRHVAVKVLPRQSLLDEHRLQRFQREAQTAARLHHTNIVPIFGVGEQDGYHYYVMQFIRGLGIDRVVRELRGEPPPTRPDRSSTGTSMAGLARQAASALRNGRFPEAHQPTGDSDSQSDTSILKDWRDPAPGTEPAEVEAVATQEPDQPTHRNPEFWRSVARVGMQVADALSYAHSQGTLHRDIKPANLLLDGNGVVWVTDFGLAKAIEDSNITDTGDVVGTLQYMAPEQFCGNYDARSDIYCLGLTLYELLTLQAAHAGSNRSGLIHKVTQGTPTPPRRIDPSIPADLETVILKAISREPSHRYQTSGELRDDLQRFLDDRPILARRTNPAQLVWRWCRRNRSLASAIGVAILATLGLTLVGWMGFLRETDLRTETQLVNERMFANLKLHRQAFEKIFQRIVGPDMFQSMIRVDAPTESEDGSNAIDSSATDHQSISIPVVSQKDAKLLQDVLDFYDLFATQNVDYPELQFNAAVAFHHVGDIHLRLGQFDEARFAYIRAIQQYKRQGDDREKEIASVRNQLGQVYANQRMINAARESYTLVIEALELEDETPRFEEQRWRFELARAHDFMGSLGTRGREEDKDGDRRGGRGRRGPSDSRRGPKDGRRGKNGRRGSKDGRRGQDGRRESSGSRRRPPGSRPWDAEDWLATHLRGPSSTERRMHHESAQRLLAQLVEEAPENPAYRLAKARSCRNFAYYHSRERGNDHKIQAHDLLGEAIELLEALVDEAPHRAHYQFELAETLISVRPSRSTPTESSERRAWISRVERAEKILRGLHEKNPTDPSFSESLARALYDRHHSQMRRRDRVAGIASLNEILDLLEELRERKPNNTSYLRQLSERRLAYAGILKRTAGRSGIGLGLAITQLHQSIAELKAFRAQVTPLGRDNGLEDRFELLAELLESTGDEEGAEDARRQARLLKRDKDR